MSDVPSGRDPSTPRTFAALAYLYGPADPARPSRVVELQDGWASFAVRAAPTVDVVLWGRMPAMRPSSVMVVEALRRESALARLRARPPSGLRVAEVHRLPPVGRPGRVRSAVRSALMSGLMVELVSGERPERVIDAVMVAAGATNVGAGLRPSGDGSALARLSMVDGSTVELRVAREGHTKDPRRGRAALLALQAAGVPLVPRPVAEGLTAGARWATETLVSGGHPERLTPRLLGDVTALCARFPAGPTGADAIGDQLAHVAAVFPGHATAIAAIRDAARDWADPAVTVLQHGDIWLNNLLIHDGGLSGLIDWDTWHPGGLPGTDLLGLAAAEERTRSRRDFGTLLVDDFWRSPRVLDTLEPYFRQRGLAVPDDAGLAALAVAWWASRVTESVERVFRPASDPAWVRRNVDLPLERLSALRREFA